MPVGFGCRTGVCHNCESGLLAGAVSYDIDPLEPIRPTGGSCSAARVPTSELTLDL